MISSFFKKIQINSVLPQISKARKSLLTIKKQYYIYILSILFIRAKVNKETMKLSLHLLAVHD